MSAIKMIWKCLYSPRLIRIYSDGHHPGIDYEPNSFEKWGDQVIQSMVVIWNLGLYTSPLILTVLYRRGSFVLDSMVTLAKVLTGVSLFLAVSYCIRGFGRYKNRHYESFLSALEAATRNNNAETKNALRKFDFEFYAWPIDFSWKNVEGDESKQRITLQPRKRTATEKISSLPCHLVSYIVANTFGLKLMYPGSVKVLQYLMSVPLLQGRTKLVEENRAMRYKLQARDMNDIDIMVIDQRKGSSTNKNTLVICCEGNAGFYEVGIVTTPLQKGYSVIGWNHPGFGGSTGVPFPDQEVNAIDIVMQFAIHDLKFEPQNIVLFGWSIGGFSATWVAMNYPDIKGLVLDATFDDVLPLAVSRMPPSWEPIVRRTIRDYLNLNNQEQLARYNGPVLIVRRSRDEIICSIENDLSTNRGNHLLVSLLRHRFPRLVDNTTLPALYEWLATDNSNRSAMTNKYSIDEDLCHTTLASYISEYSATFPIMIGEELTTELKKHLLLFIASKYLIDYQSTHCTPLPPSHFHMPWELPVDTDDGFVKID